MAQDDDKNKSNTEDKSLDSTPTTQNDTTNVDESLESQYNNSLAREKLVANAIKFLEASDVKDAPRVRKATFLESKGLNKAEIDAILPPEQVSTPPVDQQKMEEMAQAEMVAAMTRVCIQL